MKILFGLPPALACLGKKIKTKRYFKMKKSWTVLTETYHKKKTDIEYQIFN